MRNMTDYHYGRQARRYHNDRYWFYDPECPVDWRAFNEGWDDEDRDEQQATEDEYASL